MTRTRFQNMIAGTLPWLLAAVCVARPAAADDAAASAGLTAQERARALAVELVRGVIDGQLRQLEENGLADRPIHADIRGLRGAIESLMQKEMQEVIDLLGRADAATAADRREIIGAARTRARAIVTRLAAERQQVVRRLKEATLAAEARAVLERQSRLLATTESLPTLADGRREQAILAAIDEERNVKTLLATLQASLADVSTWGGETGAMALAGLWQLEKENVAAAVLAAENSLAAADPAGAAAEQRRAIAGLESVLSEVEGNQAGQRVDPAATGKDAAALARKAAAMRIEMAKVPLTDATVERLLAEQAALQEALAKLVAQARGEPAVTGFVARAKEAAIEVAAGLLEGDQQRALASQDVVIDSLEQLAKRLEASKPAAASAEDFARQAAELMNLLDRVQDVSKQQAEIGRAAAARPQAAVEAERQLAARIAKLLAEQRGAASPEPGNFDGTRAGRGLPAAVEQRLQIAAEAAAQAARSKTPSEVQSAVQVATEAMQTAAREIANALADARRKSLAAKAGELSRAAEVAERAAAAEQDIAEAARQAAEQPPAQQAAQESDAAVESAADLAAQQAEVAALTDTMKDAVDGLSPEAAKLIEAARAAMEAAKKELAAQAAGEQAAAAAGEQAPGDKLPAGKAPLAEKAAASPAPADKAPEQAAAEASARAAQSLAKAAATMRDEAKKTDALAKAAAAPGGNDTKAAELAAKAKELARAAEMTERAAAAERGIEEATKQAADRAEQLTAAEAKPPAPAAREALEATAEELARKQAEVAEAAAPIEDVAAALAPEAAKMIEAARAEMKAAEELLASRVDGDEKTAGTNNGEQTSAEQTAANQAKQPGEQAAKAPGEQVAKQPGEQGPKQPGQQAGTQAAKQAAASAAKAAEQASESLAKAAAAMRKDAQMAAEELARTAAEQAAAASQARQAAEQAAAAQSPTSPPPGQQAGPTSPQQPAGQPQPGTTSPRNQAESLAARESAVARDELLANEIAAAIAEQSSAREAVAATARQLEQMPAGATPQPTADDREQMAAALAAAKEQFANAQRAVGERVAAMLDQSEVGNQPLRESLAEASPQNDLGTGFVPESPETTADMIAGEPANPPANQSPAATPNSQQSASQQSSSQQSSSQQSSSQQSSSQQSSSQQSSSQQSSAQQDRSSSGGRTGEARDEGPLSESAGVDRKGDAGSRGGDTDLVDKSFERDAWFAKLPPEVRKAIRAGSQRRAPRGYEEKMDRYFKNLE